ncbi:hypothetical protein Tco_0281018 [Tanacetum coccineum]
MDNLSEDIQCAGSDTRPPMLDRTDFASWQHCIRLYCQGKENGVNIPKSIDEGLFQMGTFWETLAEGNEGALHLGPERARVYSDLSPEDRERYNAHIRATNILLQGLPKDIYTLINHYTDAKDIWDNVKMLLEGSELTKEDPVKLNRGLRDFNYDQLYAYLKQHEAHANENKMMLERFTQPNVDHLALMSNESHQQTSSNTRNQAIIQDGRVVIQNVQGHQNRGQGNNARGASTAGYGGAQNGVRNANPGQVKQIKCYNCNGGQDNAVDEDVDEKPVQDLALNMDNVFQADDSYPIYDEANPLYDSDILSEVPDHDNYQDAVCEHHEVHEMHDDVQPNYVVDLHADYTSDSNMIPYDQYVKDNVMPVVQSNVSSVPNDAYMMILNDMHEQSAQYVSVTTQNNVVDKSLTVELATYKEQVELVAIGYKNPLCLIRAKQVQPALYNGHEIIKTNHVLAIMQNSKDTLEIAEITRKKMNEKIKDPECVKKKVKIAPHNYSKENYLATFTPQTQLTPEQIFWSKNLIKMKAEALKEQTIASRPIKMLTVYPPNTPPTLVPRVLPTKSQVKINIFALIQLFLEFEKTYKKRITPTGLTEGERGFEQTKECYLTEVITFFKTLKGHFEGIQKAPTKEIKEMKEVFEELEAKVDQNVVNRKYDEIEWKNLLISNDNLIAYYLSKEVFYIAINSELTVSRFTAMHDAYTVVQARCLELEAKLSKLHDKVQKDDHTELVKHFSNLEVNYLNLQLKYQNIKESFGNNTSPPAQGAPDFDSVFVIEKMKASIQGKDNAITQLTEKVTILQEQNELFRAENAKIKQHYNELYDYIKITCARHIEQTTALLTENENLKAQIHENLKCITMDSVKLKVLAPGRYAIYVEPIPPRNRNNREVHLDYLKHLKESVETLREIVEEAKVDRPLDRSLASACLYTKNS